MLKIGRKPCAPSRTFCRKQYIYNSVGIVRAYTYTYIYPYIYPPYIVVNEEFDINGNLSLASKIVRIRII